MARYDRGWGGFPRETRYDHPYRSYGPPRPVARPGGMGRAGFRPVAEGYDPDFTGWGAPRGRRPWGDVGGGPAVEREEGWETGAIYGPARYGLGPYHERLRRHRRSDEELKEEVEEALFYDTWVDADAIAVEVSDGIVTLRGELPDHEEIRYATDDVWDVDGVRGVRSELTVRDGTRRTGGAERAAPAAAPAAGEEGAAAGAAAQKGGGEEKAPKAPAKKKAAGSRSRKKADTA